MNKRALILGITGQDGSYLADLLLQRGYDVHGAYRRSSVDNLVRVRHILNRVVLHRADLSDGGSIDRIVRDVRPSEIYNEADQDHVGFSKETPEVSIDITAGAVQRLLETILRVDKRIRLFQPLSATMFKDTNNQNDILLNEDSEIRPSSPYACAKLAAWSFCDYYKREYGLWVACGILFNHESERRGDDYLLQRIVRRAREVCNDAILKRPIGLMMEYSNINMLVDIGYAPDYMEAAYLMLQKEYPSTFCIGTGVGYSIKQYCEWALEATGLQNVSKYIKESYPPMKANQLVADITRANEVLGWMPTTTGQALIQKLMRGVK